MNIDQIIEKFNSIFGESEAKVRAFQAPGRVNLIGEHTDYNGGYVFPAAVAMNTTVIVRPRKDRMINLAATDLEIRVSASLDKLENYKKLDWGNYQLGVAYELEKAGYKLAGCDMLYHDTVPHGAGLSSSAAIEVATVLAMINLSGAGNTDRIDMMEAAKISQRAENNYVGVNCGIMDQFASAMGRENHAIFLNCRDLTFKHVPLNLKGFKIVIGNTNKKRGLGDSKYNERRKECEEGMEILKKAFPTASCLGEITFEQFEAKSHLIQDETIKKRVSHVISENDRVLRSVEALIRNDLKEFGRLMVESHNSLKDLYEVTGIELNTMVEEALKAEGVLGSRMTGAGFGGCTVSIVEENAVDVFIEQVGTRYYERVGLKPAFYITEAGKGAGEVI